MLRDNGIGTVGREKSFHRPIEKPAANDIILASLWKAAGIQEVETWEIPQYQSQTEAREAENRSLFVHSKLRADFLTGAVVPDAEVIEDSLDKLLKTFAVAKVKISDNFLDYQSYIKVLENINWKATPGYPLCRTYNTIGDLYKWDGISYDPRIAKQVYEQLMHWIAKPMVYPFRVFIKVEPLAPAKAEVGRWRLIFGAPLYLQLLDHLLNDAINASIMEHRYNLPAQIGWNPFWGNSEWAVRKFTNPYSLDKSLFDWTVSGWLIDAVRQFRHEIVVAPKEWHTLLDFSYDYSFNRAQFMLSDGQVYEQKTRGLMKSGLVNTLADNTLMQCFLQEIAYSHCNCEARPYIAIGDDVLMEAPCEHFESNLKQYCKLKYMEPSYNFAGFNLKIKEPEYWSKHINKLIFQEEKHLAETLETYTMLYCFSKDKFNYFSELLQEIDLTKVKTARYWQRWAS